eukprot:scaffold4675_cov378-Prasinococcus_capsulatus_cf.AAC.8
MLLQANQWVGLAAYCEENEPAPRQATHALVLRTKPERLERLLRGHGPESLNVELTLNGVAQINARVQHLAVGSHLPVVPCVSSIRRHLGKYFVCHFAQVLRKARHILMESYQRQAKPRMQVAKAEANTRQCHIVLSIQHRLLPFLELLLDGVRHRLQQYHVFHAYARYQLSRVRVQAEVLGKAFDEVRHEKLRQLSRSLERLWCPISGQNFPPRIFIAQACLSEPYVFCEIVTNSPYPLPPRAFEPAHRGGELVTGLGWRRGLRIRPNRTGIAGYPSERAHMLERGPAVGLCAWLRRAGGALPRIMTGTGPHKRPYRMHSLCPPPRRRRGILRPRRKSPLTGVPA